MKLLSENMYRTNKCTILLFSRIVEHPVPLEALDRLDYGELAMTPEFAANLSYFVTKWYSGPKKTSVSIGWIPPGESFLVAKETDGYRWTYVVYGDKVGYIRNQEWTDLEKVEFEQP